MRTTQIRPVISRAAAASVAVVLGLTLSACGSDDSESSDSPLANNSAEDQGGQPDSDNANESGDSGDADRPDNLSDFPLPDDYTVVTSGSRGGAWTAVLKVPAEWTEVRDLYKDGLTSAGWTIAGSHPLRDENSIQFDWTKDDMEATVAISSVDGATDLMINVVKD